KLDACAAEVQWVGFDADSTHTHRIYWPDKNRTSVECDIKFVPANVSIHAPLPFIPNSTSTTSKLSPTQPTIMQAPTASQLPTLPVSKVITSTSKEKQHAAPLPPPATNSGEEEKPDEEEGETTAPEQQTITQQSSAPAVQRSSHITQQIQGISTLKNKNKNKIKSFNGDSPQFIDNRVFRGYHPDYRGNPPAVLLADNEQCHGMASW
ncbi:hypothetical protein BJV74DRAFT_912186, partial [Russula compacta]